MITKHLAVAGFAIAMLSGCADQPTNPSAEMENAGALHGGMGYGSGNRSEPDTSTQGDVLNGNFEDVSRGGFLGGSGN